MHRRCFKWVVWSALVLLLGLVACDSQPPDIIYPTAVPPLMPPTPIRPTASPTAPATPTRITQPAATSGSAPTLRPATAVPPRAGATLILPTVTRVIQTCPPAATLSATTGQIVARVNGASIPLERFNREVAQAQAALTLQSGAGSSQSSAEILRGVRRQVLDQLIDAAVITQQAERSGILIADNDLNAELARMVQAAGGPAKLNDYLSQNRLSLNELCVQIRDQFYGAAMLKRVSDGLPEQAEQVHVRQILVSSASQAQSLRDRVRRGEDMGALARQYSMDPVSKPKGGDIGWMPRGILDPAIEASAFALPVNQVSDVLTTRYGYAIIQVLEKDPARALAPEVLQAKQQALFLTWVQATRAGAKIEIYITP